MLGGVYRKMSIIILREMGRNFVEIFISYQKLYTYIIPELNIIVIRIRILLNPLQIRESITNNK